MSYWTGGRYGYNGVPGGGIPSEKLIEKPAEKHPQRNMREELHEIAKTKGIHKMLEALNNITTISYERKLEFMRDYLDNHA